MKKALIVIDYTNDFVATDGALTCGAPAQDIEAALVKLTDQFIQQGDQVIFAVDLHEEGDTTHPETKLFPPHNIEGSDGRKCYGALGALYEQYKHLGHVHWMDKTRYSAFAGTNLDSLLRTRDVKEVHLVGVCTSICVLHTAVEAYNKDYSIVVHRQAVADFNQEAEKWALHHMKNTLGAHIEEQ